MEVGDSSILNFFTGGNERRLLMVYFCRFLVT